jgi:hypothetical protein
MNIYPSFTNIRSFMSYKFSMLRMRALRDLVWAKLTGRETKLAVFPGQEQRNNPNRRLLGTKDIPVEEIIGTFNRESDFDHQFRPLSKHLCTRWINTCINLERDAWPSILVHKIGEHYYVEDGHHRVSVARSIGMAFIEAKVWEYPVPRAQTETCQSTKCAERSSSKAYAAG